MSGTKKKKKKNRCDSDTRCKESLIVQFLGNDDLKKKNKIMHLVVP